MVEGQARNRLGHDALYNGIGVIKDGSCRNTQCPQTCPIQPGIARRVALGLATAIVGLAVNLDRQARVGTVEIEDIRAARVLPPIFETAWMSTKRLPQDDFGHGHGAAKLTGASDCS
jgi:hypothetical protein